MKKKNQIRFLFDKYSNDIRNLLPRKEIDWWIFDIDQFNSVPSKQKKSFVGFLSKKKILNEVSEYRKATNVKDALKGDQFDQFILDILIEYRGLLEQHVLHVSDL